MSIGQQWAVVFLIFWAASCWYCYSLGWWRGSTHAYKDAAESYSISGTQT